MRMRVHRMEILIVDQEGISDADMAGIIGGCKFAYPSILAHESREVEWTDEHPLNRADTQAAAVVALFGGK